MSKRKTSKTTSNSYPEVKLRIEIRQSTTVQQEAGNRLFSKLVTRAKEKLAEKIGVGGMAEADRPL